MSTSEHLVVMYHYVREQGGNIPAGIRPLMAHDFEAQLDWLSQHYDIVGADEFLLRLQTSPRADPSPGCTSGAPSIDRPACLLTFDDGTRDHAEVVAPILKRRKLSGVFFVLTWPMEERRMPLTHAVHWLLSQDERQVWDAFVSHARQHLNGEPSLGDPAEARRIYHYETELRGRIKYAANMALPPDATDAVVRQAAASAGVVLDDLADQWFASPDQIRQMHRDGMTIAIHGMSHRSAAVLGPEGIRHETHHTSEYLTRLLGQAPMWFACAFGASGATPQTLAAMRQAMTDVGVRAAVSTAKDLARPGTDPLAIPRVDCIDLPPRGTWLTTRGPSDTGGTDIRVCHRAAERGHSCPPKRLESARPAGMPALADPMSDRNVRPTADDTTRGRHA